MHLADASMSAAGLGSRLSLSGVRGAGIIAEHGNTFNWRQGLTSRLAGRPRRRQQAKCEERLTLHGDAC